MRQMTLFSAVFFLSLTACISFKINLKSSKPILSSATAEQVKNPVKSLLLTTLVSFSLLGDLAFETVVPKSASSIARADSTGKFSTKLTARKRYLPRIINGVYEFKQLSKDPSMATKFVEVTLPNLERAMNLYGASLRKGETPDEISRNAEKLTEIFKNIASGLSKTSTASFPNDISKSKDALNAYLKFALLSEVDSNDYNALVPTAADKR